MLHPFLHPKRPPLSMAPSSSAPSSSAPKLKLLESTQISPPAGSIPPTTMPLTFFDVLLCRVRPVQRLFLFQLPSPTTTAMFLNSHLPNLKHALSLALELFYPLSGKLQCTTPSDGAPCITYTDGDSIALSVHESGDNFFQLTQNSPIDSCRLHRLVPNLSTSEKGKSIVALQLTFFPDSSGLAIGIATNHGAADGFSVVHFIRTWASFYRAGESGEAPAVEPPILDRSMVKDPKGLLQAYLHDWEIQSGSNQNLRYSTDLTGRPDVLRTTFPIPEAQMELLRQHVWKKTSTRCSGFAAACGVAWASMVRARWGREQKDVDGGSGDEVERFVFTSDCRGRLKEPPVPKGYFGNCITLCSAEVKRRELVGEGGVAKAAAAIWAKVMELKEEEGALKGAESWVRDMVESGRLGALSVSGSPRLAAYDVGFDFGWGRTRRVEVVSVETRSAMCLAENKDQITGGYEIGIGLEKTLMQAFSSALNDITTKYCSLVSSN